jgi:hypothetical protein
LPKDFEITERAKWNSTKTSGKREDDINSQNSHKRSSPMKKIWAAIEGNKDAEESKNTVPYLATRKAELL